MKKLIVLVLALALLLGLASVAEEKTAYGIGDSVNGFTVTDVRRFDLLGADVTTLVHDKTRATVMLILNGDTDRVFDITFRTIAENENGTPHVFEHATLDGSANYPSRELFFNLSYQTYNTYMNAATYPYMTTYPVASLSEAQLLKYADYYLDSCFNPILMTEEGIFDEEAWRYSLTSADADLTITGTVYNEMKGAYTLSSASYFNFLKAMFPGSTIGNVSGGKPSDIPNLTYEEVRDYHDRYYHPSNSVTYIYGDIENPAAFLELLDKVFSAYDYRSFEGVFDDAGYVRRTESAEVIWEYGTEQGSDSENGAEIFYAYLCPEADLNVLDLLTTLINDDSSAYKQLMKQYLPSASSSCYVEFMGPDLVVMFNASGLNASDAQTYTDIVKAALNDIAENGFSSDAVDAIASNYALSILLSAESGSTGVNIIPNLAYYWVNTGNLYGYMDYVDVTGSLTEWALDGTMVSEVRNFLNEDAVTVLSITTPVPGLKEAQDAVLASELAEIKAGMTIEEINALVEETNSPAAEKVDTAQMVASLTAVTVDSLPEDVRMYDIEDATGEDGVRRLYAPAEVAGVGTTMVRLPLVGLTQDEMQWMQLYLAVIGEVDTASHTQAELSSLITRWCYDASVRLVMPDAENENGFTPYLNLNFTGLDDELAGGYDVLKEALFESDFSDTERIAGIISANKTSLRQAINSEGYSVMLYRMFGNATPSMALYNHVNYLPYYDFLCAVESLINEQPEAVTYMLTSMRDYLMNAGNGAITAYAGGAEGYAAHTAAADAFVASLGKADIEPQLYTFEATPESEALITETNTSYNLIFASWDEIGYEAGYSADMDALCMFVQDQYLMPLLRDEKGAYGAYVYASEDGIYMFTYRDPNVIETFMTLVNLGEMVSAEEGVTQEVMDGYILSSYSAYASPKGELSGAFMAIRNCLAGDPADQYAVYMNQLKNTKPEDLAPFGELLTAAVIGGRMATVSSAAVIGANESLYENVMNPFSAIDTSKLQLTDVAEDDMYYTEIRACIDAGLMTMDADGCFCPEAAATLADVAVPMYMMIGGDNNAEDAIGFLASYEIVDPYEPSYEPTREDLVIYLGNFFWAIGYEFDESTDVDYADAADIMEGAGCYWYWALENGLISLTEDGLLDPAGSVNRAEMAKALYNFFI